MATLHPEPISEIPKGPTFEITKNTKMIRASISSHSILSSLTKLNRPISSGLIHNASSKRCFRLPINPTGFSLRSLVGVMPRRGSTAMAMSSSASTERHLEAQLLPATEDEHDGVIVEMRRPIESQAFSSMLRSSISHWTQLGKKGVWLKLPIEHANLVDAAVKEGFYYHHAEQSYLMLARWLPETENPLPANASHRVGVGAFVINERKEVLVVQEKNGMLRRLGVWKFPTGVANEGEDIGMAAVREVKEETGVDAKFVEVLTFRQSHNAFFQKSDLYFVCLLEASSFDIQIQESEILAAKWMRFEEYAAQSFVQKHELLRYITKICSAQMEGKYRGFSAVSIQASFRPAKDCLFLSNDTPIEQ